MRRAVLAAALAACGTPADHKLPGASITPHLAARMTANACGDDVALDGRVTPAIRYRYAYDAFGRLAHATGTYASGPDDTIDYTYDNLDHLTHQLQTRAWGDARVEVVAAYDTLGDLLDYTWTETAPHYSDMRRYVYMQLTDAGQPTREVISQQGQPDTAYTLEYDASNRIARVVQDGGSITTYTYDDAGERTLTVDTDGGAYHGVIVYDDRDRELSETWDGTDPQVIATETAYEWAGDRLLSMTYRSGTTDAPHALAIAEVDTLRYDCP